MFIIFSFILDLYRNERDGKCGRKSKSRRKAAIKCQVCQRSRNGDTDGTRTTNNNGRAEKKPEKSII